MEELRITMEIYYYWLLDKFTQLMKLFYGVLGIFAKIKDYTREYK